MPSVQTETETVIKRILPYLRRRGYEPETDIDFETAVRNLDRYTNGYVDLLVTCGNVNPLFVIEAKRNGKTLSASDVKQAAEYATALKTTFFVVTNGQIVQVYNTHTRQPLSWNGRVADKVPSKEEVKQVVAFLRKKKDATDVPLGKGDESLPFRPSLPLKQLNDLFNRCHNKIRNIEKNEDYAFSDFSKILFLKLLEEKEDAGDFTLPYSFRFWELAERSTAQADQVKSAILQMLSQIKNQGYGDVLTEELHLKNPATFRYVVGELAKVSFADSDHDVKGTAFEYFVRATLKGKKLGQYFTPRPVVAVMVDLIGREAVVSALRSGGTVQVGDPACGTGGFLVYLLKACLAQLDELLRARKLTRQTRDELAQRLMHDVFRGADANEGVASAAKMNMIIAGDGHNNIVCENSALPKASIWPIGQELYDFILTNPPFGTAEGDSLSAADQAEYPVSGASLGQHLFLQRMVMSTKPGGIICTVIDEGLLNTGTGAKLRRWVMQHAELLAVLQLPEETFKPNKINVRSSVLLLRKRDAVDIDLSDSYPIAMGRIHSLGYHGSGEPIRGSNFDVVRESLSAGYLDHPIGSERDGTGWDAFDVSANEVAEDGTCRWDRKYWEPSVRSIMGVLNQDGEPTIRTLNTFDPTTRGRSPSAALYVDQPDGYAVVVKAGSCITRYGEIDINGADWIEKAVFDELPKSVKLQKGDVLLASTGSGTLGKVAVWDRVEPAAADGHVTIIRPDASEVDSYYLADYLRCGFGHDQVERLYTGSTGLIELTPEDVDRIAVTTLPSLEAQRELSLQLRTVEAACRQQVEDANSGLDSARFAFASQTSQQEDSSVD